MSMFFASPELTCFEGDPPTPPTPPTPSDDGTFSQEDLNRFLAEDRRKHQEKYKTLESSYQKILQDKGLEAEQRDQLKKELDTLQATFRTKEQQIEYERKQQKEKYENELQETKEMATKYKDMYTDTIINQSLQIAAAQSDAFNSSQIIGLLKPMVKMQEIKGEDGKATGQVGPMIVFPDVDEKTGEPINTLRTPAEAVKRMKELPSLYGNLFRANVVSGVGAGAATGGVSTEDNVDLQSLSTEQYMKLRAENPERLGLKKR